MNIDISSRITPTYMGNTRLCRYIRPNGEDHPHIHGEYLNELAGYMNKLGSPPHTWGILGNGHGWANGGGITPTYMGNTRHSQPKSRGVEDHPHIHGEYHMVRLEKLSQLGSPPHTWGILRVDLVLDVVQRITPTYMGNTATSN